MGKNKSRLHDIDCHREVFDGRDPYLEAWAALTPDERLLRSWRLRGRLADIQSIHDAKTFPEL
jgi:hypothetical protein